MAKEQIVTLRRRVSCVLVPATDDVAIQLQSVYGGVRQHFAHDGEHAVACGTLALSHTVTVDADLQLAPRSIDDDVILGVREVRSQLL